jgi:phenylacetate-CoA ligase
MGIWEGAAASAAYRAAGASPLIKGHVKRIDRLAQQDWEDIKDWQSRRLKRVLKTARVMVPYYKKAIYESDDLQSMPVLDKQTVRDNAESLRNRLIPARAMSTGGTGGQPLLVYISLSSYFEEWGHIAYAWRSGGVSLTTPKISFKGGSLGRGFGESPIFFQRTYNHFVVSPFHLREETFRMLIDRLDDFSPKAIWGYASAVSTFAQWVQHAGPFKQLDSIKTVLLGSEPAYDWQISLLESVFGARVVRWYGMSEKSVFAVECEARDGYHVIPTYGITEVLDDRIIGTGFTNAAMPLVRYDTEDKAAAFSTDACSCGLPFPRLKGISTRRDQTFLYGTGDEPISTVALNFHDSVFAAFSNFQFRQTEPGRITLLLVPKPGSDVDSVAAGARAAMQGRIGDRCVIEVEIAEAEELLSERGKLLVVDQRYEPGQ